MGTTIQDLGFRVRREQGIHHKEQQQVMGTDYYSPYAIR